MTTLLEYNQLINDWIKKDIIYDFDYNKGHNHKFRKIPYGMQFTSNKNFCIDFKLCTSHNLLDLPIDEIIVKVKITDYYASPQEIDSVMHEFDERTIKEIIFNLDLFREVK